MWLYNILKRFLNPLEKQAGMELTQLQQMIGQLKARQYIKDLRVENVMLKVDRAHYCPSSSPYTDSPHSINYGATISAPHMHAFALEALIDKLVDGAKVLDVGSGTGYLTACMAHMVGPRGLVYGIDHIKELVDQSHANIIKDDKELLDSGRVKILMADGRAGLPQYAPYDAIHVGATAPELPENLVSQLKEGGRMVLPIQRGEHQIFESVEKLPGGAIERRDLLRVVYVPLTDIDSQLARG